MQHVVAQLTEGSAYDKDGTPFRNFLTMRPVWEDVPTGAPGCCHAADIPHNPLVQRRLAFYVGVQFEAHMMSPRSHRRGRGLGMLAVARILELYVVPSTLPLHTSEARGYYG